MAAEVEVEEGKDEDVEATLLPNWRPFSFASLCERSSLASIHGKDIAGFEPEPEATGGILSGWDLIACDSACLAACIVCAPCLLPLPLPLTFRRTDAVEKLRNIARREEDILKVAYALPVFCS